MDEFLSQNYGLCRKQLAKDGSSIFRAVSDKLFLTQAYHHHVRQRCFEYKDRHRDEFQEYEENDDCKEFLGIVDMLMLSKIYHIEFFVFHRPDVDPVNITQSGHSTEIYLVHTDEGHNDVVQTRARVQNLAICQSIIYEVLYGRVFGLSAELTGAVAFIRQQKKNQITNGKAPTIAESWQNTYKKLDFPSPSISERTTPPLPYRIGKALDPTLYRNVELDIVFEEKREIKQRQFGRGLHSAFCPGDKCMVQLGDDPKSLYYAHVQEVGGEENCPVMVFIEQLGEKQTVPYSSLRPLPLNTERQGYFGGRNVDKPVMCSTNESTTPGCNERSYVHRQTDHSVRNINMRFGLDRCETKISTNIVQQSSGDVSAASTNEAMDTTLSNSSCILPLTASPGIIEVPSPAAMNEPGLSGQVDAKYFYLPAVRVPFVENITHVNLAQEPSSDPYGLDLPFNDVNTLRYFFNLGVEYSKVCSGIQQHQRQLGEESIIPPPHPSLPGAGNCAPIVMTSLTDGASFTSSFFHCVCRPAADQTPVLHQFNGEASSCKKYGQIDFTSVSGDDSMCEIGVDNDGNVGSSTLSTKANTKDDCVSFSCADDNSCESREEKGWSCEPAEDVGKVKRRCYMYGSHKLVKPIKDIPPRFQMLLAENIAAKAHCEGQPIYMSGTTADLIAMRVNDGESTLNAGAQCFYPTGQQYDLNFGYDGSGGGCVTNYTTNLLPFSPEAHVSSSTFLLPPSPLALAQLPNVKLNVMYDCISTCASSATTEATRPFAHAFRPTFSPYFSTSVESDYHFVHPPLSTCPSGVRRSGSKGVKQPEPFVPPFSGFPNAPMPCRFSTGVSVTASTNPSRFSVSADVLPDTLMPSQSAALEPCFSGNRPCFYLCNTHLSTGYSNLQSSLAAGHMPSVPQMDQAPIVYLLPPAYGPSPQSAVFQPAFLVSQSHRLPCPSVPVQ